MCSYEYSYIRSSNHHCAVIHCGPSGIAYAYMYEPMSLYSISIGHSKKFVTYSLLLLDGRFLHPGLGTHVHLDGNLGKSPNILVSQTNRRLNPWSSRSSIAFFLAHCSTLCAHGY